MRNVNVIKSVAILAVIACVSVSCMTGEPVAKDQSVTIENPMQVIGEIHNLGLDAVLKEFKTAQKTRAISELDVLSAVEGYIVEEYSDLPAEYLSVVQQSLASLAEVVVEDVAYADLGTSDDQRMLLSQLEEIMSDDDLYLKSLHGRIAALEEASMMLSADEQRVLLVGCAVCRSTLEYWYENAASWGLGNTRGGPSWKGTGKADGIGAISSATGGGVGWLLGCGPVGWKAWAAVVGGGAIVASVTYVLEELIVENERATFGDFEDIFKDWRE